MHVPWIILAVLPVCSLLRWLAYTLLCLHVFDRTGDPESLKYVEQAFRWFIRRDS